MAGKVIPAEAFCAIGPDGKIDIDLVRRNRASAGSAASNVHSIPWLTLVSKGWQVIPVRVIQAGDRIEDELAPSPPRPPPARTVAIEPRAARPPRRTDGAPVLQCWDGMRAR